MTRYTAPSYRFPAPSTYYVAKANETARAFVVRAENLKREWITISESNDYSKACAERDRANNV